MPLEELWKEIDVRLALGKQMAVAGHERVYVPVREAADLIRETGGVVSIHVGSKSNSLDGIRNAVPFNQVVKEDIVKKYVDIMEVGRLQDIANYRRIVFPDLEREWPIVICSDNHDITQYAFKAPLWIRADSNFRGLQQGKDFGIVHLGLADQHVGRQVIVVVQQHVGFYPALGAPEFGPRKEAQTQTDGGGIQREQLVFEAELVFARPQMALRTEVDAVGRSTR